MHCFVFVWFFHKKNINVVLRFEIDYDQPWTHKASGLYFLFALIKILILNSLRLNKHILRHIIDWLWITMQYVIFRTISKRIINHTIFLNQYASSKRLEIMFLLSAVPFFDELLKYHYSCDNFLITVTVNRIYVLNF